MCHSDNSDYMKNIYTLTKGTGYCDTVRAFGGNTIVLNDCPFFPNTWNFKDYHSITKKDSITIVPLSKMHGTERLSYSNTMISIYHYIIYYYHCIDNHGALLKFFYVLTLQCLLM